MTRAGRAAWIAIGLAMAGFGFLCLNYTKGWTYEHHAEWAAAHSMPAPGPATFLAGVALGVLGGAVVGFALARARSGGAG